MNTSMELKKKAKFHMKNKHLRISRKTLKSKQLSKQNSLTRY